MKKPVLIMPVENQVRELDPKLLLACIAARRGFSVIIGSHREIDLHISSLPQGLYLNKSMTDRNLKMFRIMDNLGHEILTWDEEALVHLPPEYMNRYPHAFSGGQRQRIAIARALARTHEALSEMEQARQLYQEIMGRCSGCNSRVDPLIREKVADLSFAAGIHDTTILELYLTLAQELPQNAALYFDKASQIYQILGYEAEAERFSALAERVTNDRDGHWE